MPDHRSTDPTASHSDDRIEMIRSEERLSVRKEQVPARVARLEKFVVTEQRTIVVEVRHEEVRLVHDDLPADPERLRTMLDARRATPELVLSEERVETRTVVVPVERVRMVVDVVTEQREVSGTARSERIVAEQQIDAS